MTDSAMTCAAEWRIGLELAGGTGVEQLVGRAPDGCFEDVLLVVTLDGHLGASVDHEPLAL